MLRKVDWPISNKGHSMPPVSSILDFSNNKRMMMKTKNWTATAKMKMRRRKMKIMMSTWSSPSS